MTHNVDRKPLVRSSVFIAFWKKLKELIDLRSNEVIKHWCSFTVEYGKPCSFCPVYSVSSTVVMALSLAELTLDV